jgi:hypothetical protein
MAEGLSGSQWHFTPPSSPGEDRHFSLAASQPAVCRFYFAAFPWTEYIIVLDNMNLFFLQYYERLWLFPAIAGCGDLSSNPKVSRLCHCRI